MYLNIVKALKSRRTVVHKLYLSRTCSVPREAGFHCGMKNFTGKITINVVNGQLSLELIKLLRLHEKQVLQAITTQPYKSFQTPSIVAGYTLSSYSSLDFVLVQMIHAEIKHLC